MDNKKELRRQQHLRLNARMKEENPTGARRERRYGLTSERYEAMLLEQESLCAICRKRKPTDVDHSRSTGHVRGLLCRPCNLGLGMFGDDAEQLIKAAAYLQRPTQRISERFPIKPRNRIITKRPPRGEKHHSAKLTDADVRAIREEYARGGISCPKLAAKFNVHPVYLSRIVRGRERVLTTGR